MQVIVEEGDHVLGEHYFGNEVVYVGSHLGCAVHVNDSRLSPQHCVLSLEEDGSWAIEVLDTGDSTQRGGTPLHGKVPLKDGDEIRIFDYVLHIHPDVERQEHLEAEQRLAPEDLAKIKEFRLPPGSTTKRENDAVTLQRAQLDRVAQIAVNMAVCGDRNELVEVAVTSLLQLFGARCAWIGVCSEPKGEFDAVAGRLPPDTPCDAPRLVEQLHHRCVDRRQHVCIRKSDEPVVGSAMAAPVMSAEGCLGMLYVDARKGGTRYALAELDTLTAFAAAVAAALEDLNRKRARQQAAISSTARTVVQAMQDQLAPKQLPTWDTFQIAAYSEPGFGNSGDLYDVIKVPGRDIAAILIASITAAGTSLAVLMAQVRAAFRILMSAATAPHQFMLRLETLLRGGGIEGYVHCFVLLVDAKGGKMAHCRAGKIGALVIDRRGEFRPIGATDQPAVGAAKRSEYTSKTDRLDDGETLALYTRGVTTGVNAKGERFGERRFRECLCDAFGQPAVTTLADLTAELAEYQGDNRPPDDATILILHREET